MVVWQGITEGGTAVPVQITEEGKVVAIGEAGPEGPPGPPGQAEWPPNPIEGAFLVWLNGKPTWYVEQPIPTPPGVAGPIIEVDQNSLLLFESDVDQNIFFNGVQVYAVNADGSSWNGNGQYNTSQDWSAGADGSRNGSGGAYKIQNAFDGSITTEAIGPADNGNQTITITFNPPLDNSSNTFEVYAKIVGDNNVVSNFLVNGVYCNTAVTSQSWSLIDKAEYLSNENTITSVGIRYVRGADYSVLYALRLNGKILLDPLAGPYPTGQISTVANASALLSRVQGVWSEGDYMKADESAQAAWLISKKRNGKILG